MGARLGQMGSLTTDPKRGSRARSSSSPQVSRAVRKGESGAPVPFLSSVSTLCVTQGECLDHSEPQTPQLSHAGTQQGKLWGP